MFNAVTYSATVGARRNDAIQNITGSISTPSGWGAIGVVSSGALSVSTFTNSNSLTSVASNTRVQAINLNAASVARTDTQTHGADIALILCTKR